MNKTRIGLLICLCLPLILAPTCGGGSKVKHWEERTEPSIDPKTGQQEVSPSGGPVTKSYIDVTVTWTCEQTKDSNVPANQDISLTFYMGKLKDKIRAKEDLKDIGDLAASSSQLVEILNKSKANPDLDFSSCASNFMASIREMATEACQVKAREGNNPIAEAVYGGTTEQALINCDYFVNYLLRNLTGVEAGFYNDKAKVGPFDPGGSTRPALTDDDLEELETELESSCGDGLQDDYRYLDGKFLNRLPSVVQNMNGGCKTKAYSMYLDLLDQARPINCNPGEDAMCTKRVDDVLSAVKKLEAAGLRNNTNQDYLDVLDCNQVDPDDFMGITSVFRELDENFRNSIMCNTLKEGEERIIDGDMGSSVPSAYVLTKEKDSPPTYVAVVNPTFANPEHLKRTKECLALVNPKMNGPNGSKLKLALAQDYPTDKEVPPVDIDNLGPGARSNSGAWSADIDCGTITHELLHLLGLVDEYEESTWGYMCDEVGKWDWVEEIGKGGLVQFNCRIEEFTGGPNNVMASHGGVLGKAFDSQSTKVCFCRDSIKDAEYANYSESTWGSEAACQLAIKTASDTDKAAGSCPTGTIHRTVDVNPVESDGISLFKDEYELNKKLVTLAPGGNAGPTMFVTKKTPKPATVNTILNPEHFNFIVDPTCSYKNKRYNLCAVESRKTYYDVVQASSAKNKQCDPKAQRICQRRPND